MVGIDESTSVPSCVVGTMLGVTFKSVDSLDSIVWARKEFCGGISESLVGLRIHKDTKTHIDAI